MSVFKVLQRYQHDSKSDTTSSQTQAGSSGSAGLEPALRSVATMTFVTHSLRV